MATGAELSPSSQEVACGIALEFPVSDDATVLSSSPPRVPRRLQKRLLEGDNSKTPTAEEIEAKLRDADLRRQQFYEKLSCKARPKPRSPSHDFSHEEDLAQRLEAKLQAAEQKRLSILEKAQMRLARLDELRQAAKNGVEMRYKRERERLGSKVELRFQQAEANRMLILKAYKQRRATVKERMSQSLLRRKARESKYRERVRSAIHQKRVAAEKKRLGLLEAEKKRACARVLQVQQVVKSVEHQREAERRRMREQLEDRLQRARRQRAEYLRQRGRQHNSVPMNFHMMQKQADLLSRKLARCWRKFLRSRKTTVELATDFDALKINEKHVKSVPFEQFAHLIESSATLQTVKAILDRLESRFRVSRAIVGSGVCLDNIDHLLKRVATPKKRITPRTSSRNRAPRSVGPVREGSRGTAKLSRYPVRVVLCAYMILGHPDAVFSGQGEREASLAKSAKEFTREFELLIKIILEGPLHSSDDESDSMLPKRCTFRTQLGAFDKAWCTYLNCFVVWKVKDAQSLVEDLMRAACQLELSMIQKCKLTPEGDSDALTHDMKAIRKQVVEDQKLLREKIQHLSGDAGTERMEHALSETRSKYFHAKENGSPFGSPIMNVNPNTASTSASPLVTSGSMTGVNQDIVRPNRAVRSLFKEDSSPAKVFGSTSSGQLDTLSGSSNEMFITENEMIVNELLHEQHRSFVDKFSETDEDQKNIKEKIKGTMEVVFWDGVLESLTQDEPNYDRVLQLVKEARDEISDIAPESWKQEIAEAIDLEVLSQVLNSGDLDIDYFGKILEYALGALQKLCSPVHEDKMKLMHEKLLKELAGSQQSRNKSKSLHAVAMVKGLRFVLEQIQVLKQEMSKARIGMMEPLLKGPAGLDYLRRSFSNRYGSNTNSNASLPLTVRWLTSANNCKDEEWEEHISSLAALLEHENSSQGLLPSTALRTGGSFQVKMKGNMMAAAVSNGADGQQTQPECNGEQVDLLVRLGLLKLVSGVSGLTQEALPETFILNVWRLRGIQAEIQKIIATATSMLIFRQTLLTEQIVGSSTEMESVMSKCTKHLLEVLDRVDNVGIDEIVKVLSVHIRDVHRAVDGEKLQSMKSIMGRMLAKSLQAGDPVFEKVSRAVYLAQRGIVLGGSGPRGRKLAETTLEQVGAVILTERVVEAAEELVVAAIVTNGVHGPWYTSICEQMQ